MMSARANWIAASTVIAVLIAVLLIWFSGWPFNHLGPPKIVEGLITNNNWTDQDDANRKLTAMLSTRFPNGTDVEAVKKILIGEGFKPPPPHAAFCKWSSARQITICDYSTERRLEYEWGGAPCSQSIYVSWTSDDHNRLTSITGYVSEGCM